MDSEVKFDIIPETYPELDRVIAQTQREIRECFSLPRPTTLDGDPPDPRVMQKEIGK